MGEGRVHGEAFVTGLTFWFDVHSPWAYLASFRVGGIARKHKLPLRWRPLHLPRLIDEIGGLKPLEAAPQRVAWFRQDIADWAALQGVPLKQHPDYPLRNSRALRACVFAEEQGAGEAFARRVLQGYWAEQGDITDLDLLADWGAQAGIEREAVKAAAASEDYKQRLDDNTQDAIQRGVFGVPTVDTGTKLYFGNDRLDLLDIHLTRGTQPPA